MGFGTLFIGYFFLINISYFVYTDIIAGAVMLLALYNLRWVNRPFFTALAFCGAFFTFSLAELIGVLCDTFVPGSLTVLLSYVQVPRYILIFALTITILGGICEVAKEVEANELSARARHTLPFTFIYLLMAVLDLPELAVLGNAVKIISIITVIALVTLIAVNLVTIYRAYMQICMPESAKPAVKKSRIGFVQKFREYEEAKSREYAEYKLEKMKKNNEKRNKKKK